MHRLPVNGAWVFFFFIDAHVNDNVTNGINRCVWIWDETLNVSKIVMVGCIKESIMIISRR